MIDVKSKIKQIKEKASEMTKDIDRDSIEEYARTQKEKVNRAMDDSGLSAKIDVLKVESSKVASAISESAKEVYNENEELLQKPVAEISGLVDKASKHKETFKWIGGITAGIVAPVPTLVATTLIYMLSDDETKEKIDKDSENETIDGQNKKKVVSSMVEILEKKEEYPEKTITETDKVSLEINLKEQTVNGTILMGENKGRSFEEIGTNGMSILLGKLNKMESKDHATEKLIQAWLSHKGFEKK